jgi:hypothetical protein
VWRCLHAILTEVVSFDYVVKREGCGMSRADQLRTSLPLSNPIPEVARDGLLNIL